MDEFPTERGHLEGLKREDREEGTAKQLSPLMGLLEWEQKALTGLDASLSDLIQKIGPTLSQPTTEKEPREQKDSHGSEFAKQYQTNIEKIERLAETIRDVIRRCDV